MAVDYIEIVAAIDAAILTWADRPVTLSFADGRSNTYRSLDELIRARDYYSRLVARSGSLRQAVRLARVIKGGAV